MWQDKEFKRRMTPLLKDQMTRKVEVIYHIPIRDMDNKPFQGSFGPKGSKHKHLRLEPSLCHCLGHHSFHPTVEFAGTLLQINTEAERAPLDYYPLYKALYGLPC